MPGAKSRYSDIVELIRFTYENTLCLKRINRPRGLVTQYIAHEPTQIAGPEPFSSLVEDNGPCRWDLLSMVLGIVPL